MKIFFDRLWWAVTFLSKTFRVTFRFLQNIELFKGKRKPFKTFKKLTSDISKSCRKYYSQNNKENGNTSPWTFSGKIFLRKMPWMAMSRRLYWRSCTLQIISHGQKWGIWRGVLKGAPGKKNIDISVRPFESKKNVGIQLHLEGSKK